MLRKDNIFYDSPLKLNVTVSDVSGKQAWDVLEIQVDFSFIFVFERVMYFAGPIIGILGLIKYQDELHEIFCKKKYQYPRRETAKIGKLYKKQTPLVLDDWTFCFKLWKLLEKEYAVKKQKNTWF